MAINQDWFEMAEIRRRRLDSAVWIPLRALQTLRSEARPNHVGFREEFFGVGSVAVPIAKRNTAEKLGWQDIGLTHGHRGWVQDDLYTPGDVFDGWKEKLGGVCLALNQDGNSGESRVWHLHQDFVITLNLKREGDSWLAVDEDYLEVARLRSDSDSPVLLEVRAEYLKDYLCARGMALYITSYRSRTGIFAADEKTSWSENPLRVVSGPDRWEGRTSEIHEGGHAFGSSMYVMHIGRKNVDYSEDVPAIGPSDTVSNSWTVQFHGEKLLRVHGELWRNEWIEPGEHSVRVRGDKLPSTSHFVINASGARCTADDLEATGGWLWFRPDVINQLCNRRGGALVWYTRDTGGVTASPTRSSTHFGINGLGLVNAFAKDIGYLPHWIQAMWAGFNVSPEGGVSQELLAAQSEGTPANSQAPEEYLPMALEFLNEVARKEFKIDIIRSHEHQASLLKKTHRFRSTDLSGLFSLAKDLARLTADSIDVSGVQRVARVRRDENLGSLKSLERLMALRVSSDKARSLLGPLFGIYELRLADAHLPSSQLEASLAKVGVKQSAPPVLQGWRLLHTCVSAIYSIAKALQTASPVPAADPAPRT